MSDLGDSRVADATPPVVSAEVPASGSLLPDLSPEARRRFGRGERLLDLGAGVRLVRIGRRVRNGVLNDGFIHAGNFAYMVLIALFPFFITGAALLQLIGEQGERDSTIRLVLGPLPPMVAATLEPVALRAVAARTGDLLWLGGLIGLWTVGSLIETIRDVLRRAYGTQWERAFWWRRLMTTGLVIGAIGLLLSLILVQIAFSGIETVIVARAPEAAVLVATLALGRIPTALGLFGALWALFVALTPSSYRARRYPKWPGAAFVCLWWLGVTLALPRLLAHVFTYDLTYGSLAGVMITLFFFWLVGLGMVIGAELNAALAEPPEERRLSATGPGTSGNDARAITQEAA